MMAKDMNYTDISGIPDLLRIAKDKRTKTKEDYEAFRAAAGGWKGLVDTDKLIADIYESRNQKHFQRIPLLKAWGRGR